MTTRNTFRQNCIHGSPGKALQRTQKPWGRTHLSCAHPLTLVFPWTWLTVVWKWRAFSLFFLQNSPLSLNSHQDKNQKNLNIWNEAAGKEPAALKYTQRCTYLVVFSAQGPSVLLCVYLLIHWRCFLCLFFFCTLLLPSEGMTLFPVSCPRPTSPPTLG